MMLATVCKLRIRHCRNYISFQVERDFTAVSGRFIVGKICQKWRQTIPRENEEVSPEKERGDRSLHRLRHPSTIDYLTEKGSCKHNSNSHKRVRKSIASFNEKSEQMEVNKLVKRSRIWIVEGSLIG